MCFESSKLPEIKNCKVKNKKFEKTFEVSIKTLYRKWEGENLLKCAFSFKQLEE